MSKPCNNIVCFTQMLRRKGFISNNETFKARVLIIGDTEEMCRTFDIEVPDIILHRKDFCSSKEYKSEVDNWKDYEVSVQGWNFFDEETQYMEIFYSQIQEVVQDLNKSL